VQGHPEVTVYASTRAKAMGKLFGSYSSAYQDTTFKEFLKIARVRKSVIDAPDFGKTIKVHGRDAFLIEHAGNTVTYAWPNDFVVRNVHELETNHPRPEDKTN